MKTRGGVGRLSPVKPGRCFAVALLLGVPLLIGSDRPPEWSETRQEIDVLFEKYRKSFPDVPVITVKEYLDRREEENLLLVDGRSREERQVSMIPGAVSLDAFDRRFDEYSGRDVVIYCSIGYRSGVIAEELSLRGLRSYNLQGGILAWTHAGKKLIDDNGETRRVHTYGPRWNLLPKGYEAVW